MLCFRDGFVVEVVVEVVRPIRGPIVSTIGVVGVLAALVQSDNAGSSWCRTASNRLCVRAVVRWYSSALGVAGDENTLTIVERPGGDR